VRRKYVLKLYSQEEEGGGGVIKRRISELCEEEGGDECGISGQRDGQERRHNQEDGRG